MRESLLRVPENVEVGQQAEFAQGTMRSANPSVAEVSPQQIAERRDDTELFILNVRNAESHENWALGCARDRVVRSRGASRI